MAVEISGSNVNHEVDLNVKETGKHEPSSSKASDFSFSRPYFQKLTAELLGTYFLVFAGCGVEVVDLDKEHVVSLTGISIVWGLVVMVMVYSLSHISGAHFNPAITLALASCQTFPWKQVPSYIGAQILGATLASGTLRLIFNGKHDHFIGALPTGTDEQALVVEIIIAFFLMFVVMALVTDKRAVGQLAGLVIGAIVTLNVLFAGPVSGASMNPARSLGNSIAANRYEAVWIYIIGPTIGAVMGAWAYNLIRCTDKPLPETTTPTSFLRSSSRTDSV